MDNMPDTTDVSHWQGTIDFALAKSHGLKGTIIKATESTFYVDDRLLVNSKNANDAGLHIGYYHFLRANYDAKVQARFFYNTVKNLPLSYNYVCDTETFDGVSGATVLSRVKTFCEEVTLLSGKEPWIYTSPGFWNSIGGYGSLGTWASRYKLWIAHYTSASTPIQPPPWKTFLFWQYTSKGIGPYYGTESLNVDLNRFNGSDAEYYSMFGGAIPTCSTVEEYLSNIDPFLRKLGYSGPRPPTS